MKNILVPTDFSVNAYDALFYATRLYKDIPCTFHLLHASKIHPNRFTGLKTDLNKTPWGKKTMKKCVQDLVEVKHAIMRDCEGFRHEFDIIPMAGELFPAIARTTTLKNIDMIVMGTQGATGAKEFFLGSNTVDVISQINQCPILALPAKKQPDDPLKIGFPSNLNHFSTREELAPFIEISTMHNAEIHILHVMEAREISDAQQRNLDQIKAQFKETKLYVKLLPRGKGKARAISTYIEKEKVSLLVMVNTSNTIYNRLIREPVVKRIGFHSNVPFLVMPEAG